MAIPDRMSAGCAVGKDSSVQDTFSVSVSVSDSGAPSIPISISFTADVAQFSDCESNASSLTVGADPLEVQVEGAGSGYLLKSSARANPKVH